MTQARFVFEENASKDSQFSRFVPEDLELEVKWESDVDRRVQGPRFESLKAFEV